MNYEVIYDALIMRAQSRRLDGYMEIHHILPRCLGGTDDLLNLVRLTPEEHFLAHQLLVKMKRYQNHINYTKLIFAANMMTVGRMTNKRYGWIKRQFSIASSMMNLGRKQSPETIAKRVRKNTGQKRSEETKKKISESKKGKSRSPFSEEWKSKLVRKGSENGMFGRSHTETTKQKVSEANRGRILSEEHKQRISDQQKGLKDSDETRKKKSEAMKKIWKERKRHEC